MDIHGIRYRLGKYLIKTIYFIFVLAVARQFLWTLPNEALAWSIAALVSLVVAYYKPDPPLEPKEHNGRLEFVLIVVSYLMFIYFLRALYPDVSYDVLNYHIFNSVRSMAGLPYISGDFFPIVPASPVADIITGITRSVLGYRLGTIINLMSAIWIALIVNREFRGKIRHKWARSLAVLYVVSSQNILFEINNYMTDVLAVPLLLESTFIVLKLDSKTSSTRQLAMKLTYVGFILGLSVSMKLTSLAFVIPIMLIGAYKLQQSFGIRKAINLSLLVIITFVVPLVPDTVYLYATTGSPIFPYYNSIFHSPYTSPQNFRDMRWGPIGLLQTLTWPFIMAFNVSRLSELPVSSYRVPFAVLVSLLSTIPRSKVRINRQLVLIFLGGALLWSFTTGYIRYGIYLEVIGSMTIVYAVTSAFEISLSRFRKLITALSISLLAFQFALSTFYSFNYEWSMRSTIFANPLEYLGQARYLFTDRSLFSFIPRTERPLISNIRTWIVCDPKTTAFESLLRPSAPAINIASYLGSKPAMEKYLTTLSMDGHKGLYTIVYSQDLKQSMQTLAMNHIGVDSVTPLLLPYFSNYTQFSLDLIKLTPNSVRTVNIKRANAPLPSGGYHATLSCVHCPSTMKEGRSYIILVKVRNIGNATWPSEPSAQGDYQIRLGNHWLSVHGKMLVNDDGRAALPIDVAPGMSVTLPLTINTPVKKGGYILELDMVQEGITWFATKGSTPLKVKVIVQ